MHRASALAIFIASCLLQRVAAANTTCPDPSLFVDIHSRSVDGKPDYFQYGLFMGLGTLSQNQSLWPSLTNNETYISSEDFCGAQASADCNNYTHGHFSSEMSTTWTETFGYRSADSDTSVTGLNVTTGTDDFHIYTHYFDPSPPSEYTIQNYTVNVLAGYESSASPFFVSGNVGLGPGSSMLNSLKQAGRIASKIVGLYPGTAYDRAGGIANGSMVLGGYDQGRIQGDVHEYAQVASPSPDASSLRISIKQVALVLPDNTTIGLIPGEGFDAYLTTSQYELQFPVDVTQGLASAIAASATKESGDALKASRPFTGNLTITLADGMVVSFPPEWVTNISNLTPISSGPLTISNTTTAANSTSVPLLFGVAFLHHLYLTINYESSTFSLAEAKIFNNFVQPQSLCPGDLPTAVVAPSQSNFVKSGFAGIILGSVIGGIGLIFFLWFVLRKRYAWKRSERSIKAMETGIHGTIVDGMPKKSNMKSSLRNKTRSFVRFASRTNVAVIQGDGEKTDHTLVSNSNEATDKGASVTTVTLPVQSSEYTNSPPVSAHELTSIANFSFPRNQLHCPPSYTSNNMSNVTIGKAITTDSTHDLHLQGQTRKTSLNHSQYATHAVMTPMTSTPRTSNPLLENYHSVFAHLDDADDSDLHLEPHELGAIANSSTENLNVPQYSSLGMTTEIQKRQNLGLTVDTSAGASRSTTVRALKAGRKKPVPLPIRIISERNAAIKPPASRGVSETRSHPTKKSGGSTLKRMFLSSRE